MSIAAAAMVLAAVAPADATANYVYHEQTSALTGGTCGSYLSVLAPTAADPVTVRYKVEYQFFTNQAKVYYTTDGSVPSGAKGVGAGATQVVNASYACTFTFGNKVIDVAAATIPAQPAGTTVRYILSAWHDGGGDEIFANSGTCKLSSCATVFELAVASSGGSGGAGGAASGGAGGQGGEGGKGTGGLSSGGTGGLASGGAGSGGSAAGSGGSSTGGAGTGGAGTGGAATGGTAAGGASAGGAAGSGGDAPGGASNTSSTAAGTSTSGSTSGSTSSGGVSSSTGAGASSSSAGGSGFEDDSGCGCRVGGHEGSPAGALAAMLAIPALAWRRRRRAGGAV